MPAGAERELAGVRRPRARLGREQERPDAEAQSRAAREHHDAVGGIRTVLEPVGTVAAIIPVTNPTSTAAFKILLALKTRCGIVLAPHPRAKACTALTARIAAEKYRENVERHRAEKRRLGLREDE